jgi:type IV pilus assembly protein PilE
MRHTRGFTLIELMIAVAIIAIISAVAIPAYQGYIETAREGVLSQNIDTMRLFQEDFRLRTGNYFAGEWQPDGSDVTLETTLGWSPNSDGADVSYVVTTGADSWTVTATDNDAGVSVTRTFP